jgi:hypothetical protein
MEINSQANQIMKGKTKKNQLKKHRKKRLETTWVNSTNLLLEILDRYNPIERKANKFIKLKVQ